MSDKIHIYSHPDCLKHDTGYGCYDLAASPLIDVLEIHPENADRLKNIKSIFEKAPINDRLKWHTGAHATREDIASFVAPDYLDDIYATAAKVEETGEPIRIDGVSTVISVGTLDAVHAAAGCTLNALNAILEGRCKTAYALIRPPGHHASRTLPDGYCLVNNAGLAAEHALKSGINKVAILDWDVHHGNGTQSSFFDRGDVFTISLHMPLGSWGDNHPELGTVEEVGVGNGKGFNLNIPLPYGSGDQAYSEAIDRLVRPALDQYKPDLLIIANGLDANQFDLNGRNLLSMKGFRAMGETAKHIAKEHCKGRMLLTQEGGYAITYTAFCAYAVLEGILGVKDTLPDPIAYPPSIEQPGDITKLLASIRQDWETASGRSLA